MNKRFPQKALGELLIQKYGLIDVGVGTPSFVNQQGLPTKNSHRDQSVVTNNDDDVDQTDSNLLHKSDENNGDATTVFSSDHRRNERSALNDALVVFRMVQTDGIPVPIHVPPMIGQDTKAQSSDSISSTRHDSTLYIGSVGSAYNWKALQEVGITHVLCACQRAQLKYEDKLTYLRIPMVDGYNDNIINLLEEATRWIDNALTPRNEKNQKDATTNTNNNRHKVLVHCMQGKSRSVAIVVAYLVRIHQHLVLGGNESSPSIAAETALGMVRNTRQVAQVNHSLWKQVQQYCSQL